MKLPVVKIMQKKLVIGGKIIVTIREVMQDVRIVLLSVSVRLDESGKKLCMVNVYIITI